MIKQPNIGIKIRELREANGFSQSQLAELVDLTKQAISSYELGHTKPQRKTVNKICEICGIDPSDLKRDIYLKYEFAIINRNFLALKKNKDEIVIMRADIKILHKYRAKPLENIIALKTDSEVFFIEHSEQSYSILREWFLGEYF